MPIRIAHHTIVIHRPGTKRITLHPGDRFDFLPEEIADIHAANSSSLRRGNVEMPVPPVAASKPEVTSDIDEEQAEELKPVPRTAGRKAGRKAAASVEEEDDEL